MKKVFAEVMRQVEGKYVLVCANKQDLQVDRDLEQFIKAQMALNPRRRMCQTTGIAECDAYRGGMEWLMNALTESDQKEVNSQKSQLEAQRKFAGLSTDEKIQKLNEIKASNDAYYREQNAREGLVAASLDGSGGPGALK